MNTAILSKIANAKATAGGNIIKDGKYLFTLMNIICEQKFGGTMFIVEMLVDEAQAVFPGVEPNKPGTMASYVVNLDKNVSAAGNAKAFVLALLGYKESDVAMDDDFIAALAELTSANQPARGMRIADETFRKEIRSGKNAGSPFTAHRWQRVDQTPEAIAKRRTEVESIAKANASA